MCKILNSYDSFIRITYNPFFFAIWLMLIMFSYFFIDQPLAYYMHLFNNSKIDELGGYISLLGEGEIYLITFLISFLLAKFLFKKEKVAMNFLFLFISVLLSSIACDVLKIILARARPVLLFQDHLYGFQFLKTSANMLSFPSGHATIITSVMLALSFILPRFWWFFCFILLIVSFSRVVVTAHFLSDIMAGMYLSMILTVWLYNTFYFKNIKSSRIPLRYIRATDNDR